MKRPAPAEMATLELRAGEHITPSAVCALTSAASRLNATLGDPTRLARQS